MSPTNIECWVVGRPRRRPQGLKERGAVVVEQGARRRRGRGTSSREGGGMRQRSAGLLRHRKERGQKPLQRRLLD